jgi:UDP-glucose 4-epimerase
VRVLVTGVSHSVGGAVARRLEANPEVEAIFGLDIADPRVALDRTEFVHADTRHSLLTKLVRGLEVDVVVHCAVLTETRAPGRTIHETNVIGTMNLLAACSGQGSPVKRVVVKSNIAVYGCQPYLPSFVWETYADPVTETLGRELQEMEQLVREFGVRNRAAATILRLGHRLGLAEPTPLGEYLRLAKVPTFIGFDPRIQLLHEEDAIEAIYRAALADHDGVFNVAGDGVQLLSQAIRLAGRQKQSVLPPYARPIARAALRLQGFDMPAYLADFLCYGCVVDVDAIEAEFGWRPAHTTRDTLLDFIGGGALDQPSAGPQEYELSAYLQRRRRRGTRAPAPPAQPGRARVVRMKRA